MHWIDIAWPMMGAVSLTLGLIYLLIWFRQRTQPALLMFSLAAMCVCAIAVFELMMMRAETPAQYATTLRWLHLPLALLCVVLVLFVRSRFHAGRPWLGIAAFTLRLAGLLPNFLTGVNLNFRDIVALDRIEAWGGGTVAIPIGHLNPWMLLPQLSNLLLILFLIDATMMVWRRGSSDEHRKAILVCGSMALFAIVAASWTVLMVLGWVRAPLSINIAFVAVIVVMGGELGGDVIRATQLAQQLGESESNLRESEQRMHLAVQAAGLGLWIWDLESNEAWLNETGNALLGLTPGEHIEREGFLARIHPEDRQAVLQARDDAIHRTGEYLCEYRLPLSDGRMRWITARGGVEYAPSGAPHLMRGVILDVTEQRQAESRFRVVVDGAPTAMLMVDAAGRITLANARAESLFGYGRSELLGLSIDMLLPERFRAGHATDRASFALDPQARPMGVGRKLFGHRKDGSEVPVEIALNPIRIGDDPFVLASITDISERLRMEQETTLQRDELAHLSRVALLGEMSGSLAHELNQPLTAILSNAQAALRFLDHDPPNLGEVRDSLLHIVENDKRAGEVIRRLRAMLRKELVNYQELEINEVVRDVLRLINSDILNRNVAVSLDLAPDLPMIRGDRVQLQQVLLNLVINACDAMDEVANRALTVRTRLTDDSVVEVSISDIGRGILSDDLERIFTPFVTSKMEGMGLGLAVCTTIIQAHHGNLWATNNAFHGATLHFTLPAERTPARF
jgi:PAS domain S-box-containing protein